MTKRRRHGRGNPFGLTHRELEALTSLSRTGSIKKTAAELQILPLTVAALTAKAARRMGKANRWLAMLALHDHHLVSKTPRQAASVFALGATSQGQATS